MNLVPFPSAYRTVEISLMWNQNSCVYSTNIFKAYAVCQALYEMLAICRPRP